MESHTEALSLVANMKVTVARLQRPPVFWNRDHLSR
jgi:hypothetical protein